MPNSITAKRALVQGPLHLGATIVREHSGKAAARRVPSQKADKRFGRRIAFGGVVCLPKTPGM
jgi:hypothetical protein